MCLFLVCFCTVLLKVLLVDVFLCVFVSCSFCTVLLKFLLVGVFLFVCFLFVLCSSFLLSH